MLVRISSQIKSAVMLAGANSYGKTLIVEKIKSRDHTEKMLKHNTHVIKIKKGKQNFIEIKGRETLNPISISVPGDPSSASFYAGLCLLNKNSKIVLRQVHINPTRIGFFNIIRKHKGKIRVLKNFKTHIMPLQRPWISIRGFENFQNSYNAFTKTLDKYTGF